jgi:Arc/MetJ-type ribon-helix-helix transcriptional regulator
MSDTRITVRLDPQTGRRLREEAEAAGKNESELVREALAAYLRHRRRPATALEVARRAGVIGCANGLPPDVSTNKDRLEGFGELRTAGRVRQKANRFPGRHQRAL